MWCVCECKHYTKENQEKAQAVIDIIPLSLSIHLPISEAQQQPFRFFSALSNAMTISVTRTYVLHPESDRTTNEEGDFKIWI